MSLTQAAEDLLTMEETAAGDEYVKTVREAQAISEERYLEIEGWAWARLQQQRRAIKARRKRLHRAQPA